MGYPVRYRSGSESRSGSQSSGSYPRAANDNRPPFRGANDNFKPNIPRKPAPAFSRGMAGRLAGRLIPGVGVALTIYEMYELYNNAVDKPPAYFVYPPGWDVKWDCGNGYNLLGDRTWSNSPIACQQKVLNVPIPEMGIYWLVDHWEWRSVYFQFSTKPTPYATNYYYKMDKWMVYYPPQPQQFPEEVPRFAPLYNPFPEPTYWPAPDPAYQPINQPAVNPNIQPRWRDIPEWDKHRNPNRWPLTNPQAPVTHVSYEPPSRQPRTYPEIAVETPTRRAPDRPPTRREKERKVIGYATNSYWAGRLVNELSEVGDLTDSFHDALPCALRLRKRATTPYERAKHLYRHFDQVNIAQGVKNALANQLEDILYGSLGQAQKKVNQRLGQAYGKQASSLRIIHRNLDELEPGQWDPFGDIYDSVADTLEKIANTVLAIKEENKC